MTYRYQEPRLRRGNSLASIAVYGMSPIGLAAYWWLRSEGLIASTPLWIFATLLVVAGVTNLGTALLCKADPDSIVRIHLRSLASASFLTLEGSGEGPFELTISPG